jgi:hypothetical protein
VGNQTTVVGSNEIEKSGEPDSPEDIGEAWPNKYAAKRRKSKLTKSHGRWIPGAVKRQCGRRRGFGEGEAVAATAWGHETAAWSSLQIHRRGSSSHRRRSCGFQMGDRRRPRLEIGVGMQMERGVAWPAVTKLRRVPATATPQRWATTTTERREGQLNGWMSGWRCVPHDPVPQLTRGKTRNKTDAGWLGGLGAMRSVYGFSLRENIPYPGCRIYI